MSYSDLKTHLIEKYGSKSISAVGHRAAALIVMRGTFLNIPTGLTTSEEKELLKKYFNGDVKLRQERQDLNEDQQDFFINCCIDIINDSPNLFTKSSVLDNEKIFVAILALGALGHSMGDQKINEKYTVVDLQDDLTRLYAEEYFEYLAGEKKAKQLNPNNKYKAEKPKKTENSSGNGCMVSFAIIFIILSGIIFF